MRSVSPIVSRCLFIAAAAVVAACAHAPGSLNKVAVAYATISGLGGEARGTAELWQDPDMIVHVTLQLHGLPPGEHGIHFHAVGKCEGAGAFATAGAHFNPLGRQHGLLNIAGPHAGDAPNFTVGSDGNASVSFTTDRVSLTPGSTTLFDADGSAIVIHAAADDQQGQPSGNSGARIACGELRTTLTGSFALSPGLIDELAQPLELLIGEIPCRHIQQCRNGLRRRPVEERSHDLPECRFLGRGT